MPVPVLAKSRVITGYRPFGRSVVPPLVPPESLVPLVPLAPLPSIGRGRVSEGGGALSIGVGELLAGDCGMSSGVGELPEPMDPEVPELPELLAPGVAELPVPMAPSLLPDGAPAPAAPGVLEVPEPIEPLLPPAPLSLSPRPIPIELQAPSARQSRPINSALCFLMPIIFSLDGRTLNPADLTTPGTAHLNTGL
jgi:hypothetical protein